MVILRPAHLTVLLGALALLGGCAVQGPAPVRAIATRSAGPTAVAAHQSSEPTAVTTSEPSPDRTPYPWPSPTARPAQATHDEQGAIAAATYLLRLIDYARATGDAAPLRAISEPTCHFCAAAMDDAAVAATSRPLTVAEHEVVAIRAERQTDGSFVVDVTTSESAVTAYRQAGTDYLLLGTPTTVVVGVQLVPVDGGWRVEGAQVR